MNLYVAYYKGKTYGTNADSLLEAEDKFASSFEINDNFRIVEVEMFGPNVIEF